MHSTGRLLGQRAGVSHVYVKGIIDEIQRRGIQSAGRRTKDQNAGAGSRLVDVEDCACITAM